VNRWFKHSFYQVLCGAFVDRGDGGVAVAVGGMWAADALGGGAALGAVLRSNFGCGGTWRANPYGTRSCPRWSLSGDAGAGRADGELGDGGLKLGFTPALIDDYRLGTGAGSGRT